MADLNTQFGKLGWLTGDSLEPTTGSVAHWSPDGKKIVSVDKVEVPPAGPMTITYVKNGANASSASANNKVVITETRSSGQLPSLPGEVYPRYEQAPEEFTLTISHTALFGVHPISAIRSRPGITYHP